MSNKIHQHDAVHWHLNEITSRIIASTGTSSDRYHMGKIIFQSLKDDPGMVAQSLDAFCANERTACEAAGAVASRLAGVEPARRAVYERLHYLVVEGGIYEPLLRAVKSMLSSRFGKLPLRQALTYDEFLMGVFKSRVNRYLLGNPDPSSTTFAWHQIDGSTGESETNASLLLRSIQCAIAFKKLGLQHGDVMVLMSQNHLDLSVAFNAALFEGIIIAPVDTALGVVELTSTFEVDKPKIVLCQNANVEDIHAALNNANIKAKVITFDGPGQDTFSHVLKFGSDEDIENYRPADFDPSETIALLIPTSGTTGLPKSAAATHKNFMIMGPYFWNRTSQVPFFKRSLVASTLQWLTAILNYAFSACLKFTRIQSSLPSTREHLYHLINTYKPCYSMITPTMMSTLLKPGVRDNCDFTCFKSIHIGGSAVYSDLISEFKKLSPETEVVNVYGMSELTCRAFAHEFSSPPHSCGKPMGSVQYRLVDPKTGEDINEPNKSGELWVKSPGLFKGYYNNQEATKEVFTEDNWFKSGDILYRDESWNFFFVERMKLLLKYMNNQISPVELESVIIQHPGVLDVAVTGIPDPERGELPVACVVKKPGDSVTAQEIKDLVKENLTDSKQLRGGVVFMEQLPTTASSKLHRRKIKEMVLSLKTEIC